MAKLTRAEAAERASEMCEDAQRALAGHHYAEARDFLEAALGQTAAIVATPHTGRRVRELGKNVRFSSSLVTGLRILECFPHDGGAMLGVADIADRIGIPRSTAHRYLITLVQLGQLEQPLGAGRKYRRPEIVEVAA